VRRALKARRDRLVSVARRRRKDQLAQSVLPALPAQRAIRGHQPQFASRVSCADGESVPACVR
jgi:hypothetical protein